MLTVTMFVTTCGYCPIVLHGWVVLNNGIRVCDRTLRTQALHGVRRVVQWLAVVSVCSPQRPSTLSPRTIGPVEDASNSSAKHLDDWPRWRRRFQQFREASGLATEGDTKQVSTLLYCMGETAEDVLTSTDISKDDKRKFDSVIAKFDSFFKVRKNVIFERARFNRRSKEDGELVEEFITSLYQLVENCEYGVLQDQMIRDRIVVGIRDQALSQRMQLNRDLTLEKAKTLSRQREAVREDQEILGSSTKATLSVDQVSKSSHKGKEPPKSLLQDNSLPSRAWDVGEVLIHASSALPEMCNATSASTRDILQLIADLSLSQKSLTAKCTRKNLMT